MSDEAERERARYEALAALVDNYRRERDDAREQLYLTKRELGRWVDRETKAVRERDEARAEVERLRARIEHIAQSHAVALNLARREGAEAMREACADVVDAAEEDARPCVRVSELADTIRALPTPEET